MKLNYLLKQPRLPMLLALAGLGFVSLGTTRAAITTNVTVGDPAFFSPKTVSITVNDSVKWTWTGTVTHSSTGPVTGTTNLWDSGLHSGPFTFTHQFTAAGSFPYKCVIHASTFFQTGLVSVAQAPVNLPPSVALTSPSNGSTFAAPWTGTIQAATADADDTVSKVDFFAGQTLLGTVNNPSANPSLGITNLAAGAYTLKAVATDSRGATNTSSSVSINVITPSPIVLSSARRPSSGSFQFNFSTDPGLTYVIRRSGNLPNWSPLQTNTATGTSENFLDSNATGAFNFYSIQLLPNP